MQKLLQEALHAPQPSMYLPKIAKSDLQGACSLFKYADKITAGPAPYHHESVLVHLGNIMDKVAGNPLAVWMAFCHDLGKLTTPKDMLPHHYGHDKRGVFLAREWGRYAGLEDRFIRGGEIAAEEHMRAARVMDMRATKRIRLHEKLLENTILTEFWNVVDADTGYSVSQDYYTYVQSIIK